MEEYSYGKVVWKMKASFWRKAGCSLSAGVILFGLRLMQNQTGFDPETGLPLPNVPGYALIAALAVVLVSQLLLQRTLPRGKFSFAAAFTPMQQLKLPLVLGGMLLAAGGVFLAVTSVTQAAGIARIVAGILGAAAGFGLSLFTKQLLSGGEISVAPLLPLLFFGVFLVLAIYLPSADDPILTRFYIPILASAAAAIAFSQLAGFLYLESGHRRFAVTGNLALSLCIASLADALGTPVLILLVGCAVVLGAFLLMQEDSPSDE